jgi:hypothetical protein
MSKSDEEIIVSEKKDNLRTNIYKVNHVVNNNITSIYVFSGSKKDTNLDK